ncbi:unnamed protein product [Arctia plantaginis]|uniref:Uncharacterized protein n=1 Tax=Arctia plantaginis TaxID=874455 RepID=A0A8S0Z8J3_ARCPL|nr:unnamed protein product [Arctia plantaginis]CAB3257128.1 unnamed protein product [Arctia plantaginis]
MDYLIPRIDLWLFVEFLCCPPAKVAVCNGVSVRPGCRIAQFEESQKASTFLRAGYLYNMFHIYTSAHLKHWTIHFLFAHKLRNGEVPTAHGIFIISLSLIYHILV